MIVFVYYNFNKKLLSIRAMEGPHKGLVVAHAESLQMKDVVFKVSEAGRQKVLREKRKSVHAGIVGEISSAWGVTLAQRAASDPDFNPRDIGIGKPWHHPEEGKRVTYNPYVAPHFMMGKRGVATAGWLQLDRSMMRAFRCKMIRK